MNPDRRCSRVRIALTSVLTALVLCGSAARAAGQESPTSMPLALCVGCHPPGQSPPAPTFPSLSGQHIEYIVKQLRDYKHGRRLSPVMVPPLATVNARDIDSIARFFNRQPVVPGRPGEAALVERGRTVYHDGVPAAGVANCGGCHEADGTGSGRFPRLAGLDPAYLAQQLSEFRTGVRHNDPARVMRVVAGRMTDDDIRAVAEYIGTLGRDD